MDWFVIVGAHQDWRNAMSPGAPACTAFWPKRSTPHPTPATAARQLATWAGGSEAFRPTFKKIRPQADFLYRRMTYDA